MGRKSVRDALAEIKLEFGSQVRILRPGSMRVFRRHLTLLFRGALAILMFVVLCIGTVFVSQFKLSEPVDPPPMPLSAYAVANETAKIKALEAFQREIIADVPDRELAQKLEKELEESLEEQARESRALIQNTRAHEREEMENQQRLQKSREMSQRWRLGVATALWLATPVMLALVGVALVLNVRKSKMALARAQADLSNRSVPFILYLRSFMSDHDRTDHAGTSDLETGIAETAARRSIAVVAVDNVLKKGVSGGATRIAVRSAAWREVVRKLAACAHGVFVDARKMTPGLMEELKHCLATDEIGANLLIVAGEEGAQLEVCLADHSFGRELRGFGPRSVAHGARASYFVSEGSITKVSYSDGVSALLEVLARKAA